MKVLVHVELSGHAGEAVVRVEWPRSWWRRVRGLPAKVKVFVAENARATTWYEQTPDGLVAAPPHWCLFCTHQARGLSLMKRIEVSHGTAAG